MHVATKNETGGIIGDLLWCDFDWGYYPHECEEIGCEKIVHYNDEPKCFTHSPDAGSSVRGYSAYRKAHGLNEKEQE
jgi:hypothetical protein